MYWREKFSTPVAAAIALRAHQRGSRSLLPGELHAAQAAVRSVAGLTENIHLGNDFSPGLTEAQKAGWAALGGLKKDIKKALKSSDPAKIAAVMAREQKKIDAAPSSKKAPKRVEYMNQLQARLTSVSAAPSTAVLPGAPSQPIPTLPAITDPASFSQGGGGGGGGNPGTSFTTPEPQAAPGAEGEGLSMPVMIGIGVAGLALLYLLTRRH